MRRLLLIALLGFSLQSQPPSPAPRHSDQSVQNAGDSKEGHGNNDKKGSKGSPARQLQSDPVVSNEYSQTTTYESKEQPSRDWWAIWLTGAIALATFAQVGVYLRQAKLMRLALEQTRQTVVLAHRPKIRVRNFYFTEPNPVGGIHAHYGVVAHSPVSGQFYIVNAGGTPAIIKEIVCQVYVESRLPLKRLYEGEIGEKVSRKLMPGATMTRLFDRVSAPLDEGEAKGIENGTLKLYVLGWIGYTDELDIYRITAFCRFWDRTKDRFIPVRDRDYEHAE